MIYLETDRLILGFRAFSCPEIFDGFSWRSMVFDRKAQIERTRK